MRRDRATACVARRGEEKRSRDRQRSIASVLTSSRNLLSRNVETDDISRRIIFLSLSIARGPHQSSYSVPSNVPMCALVEGTPCDFIRTFLPYVRLMVSAIRSKARPRGSSYLCCPCNDSFYSRMHAACDRERARMHCPHKSVNQTSLTRRYWCLAATGAERSSWRVANRPRCSRPAHSLMNRDSYGKRTLYSRARFHHSESGALADSSLTRFE